MSAFTNKKTKAELIVLGQELENKIVSIDTDNNASDELATMKARYEKLERDHAGITAQQQTETSLRKIVEKQRAKTAEELATVRRELETTIASRDALAKANDELTAGYQYYKESNNENKTECARLTKLATDHRNLIGTLENKLILANDTIPPKYAANLAKANNRASDRLALAIFMFIIMLATIAYHFVYC